MDIPDGCSTNTNTSTNILQYRDCQINAKRWKDKIHLYLYLSSIKAASHWFIPTTCLYDYQLSPKRFMIVTVTSVESNALHLADFRWIKTLISPYNPRPSPVKWVGLNMRLMEFQQKSDSRQAQAATTGTQEKQMSHHLNKYPMCWGGILINAFPAVRFQSWPLTLPMWLTCRLVSVYIFDPTERRVEGFQTQSKTPGDRPSQHEGTRSTTWDGWSCSMFDQWVLQLRRLSWSSVQSNDLCHLRW